VPYASRRNLVIPVTLQLAVQLSKVRHLTVREAAGAARRRSRTGKTDADTTNIRCTRALPTVGGVDAAAHVHRNAKRPGGIGGRYRSSTHARVDHTILIARCFYLPVGTPAAVCRDRTVVGAGNANALHLRIGRPH